MEASYNDERGAGVTEKRLALETLGCKVNQYESSVFLESLKQAGWQPVSFKREADLYVVHSCAVTSKAGFQTRQLLRRARRLNPRALVAVVGCDAQLEHDRLAAEGLATHILGSTEKFDLVRWLQMPGTFTAPCRNVSDVRAVRQFSAQAVSCMHTGRTRAYLKIQDGCNAFCSYCVVPYTRGASRSLPADEALSQLRRFVGAGYREVILTGIHLGQWGRDLEPAEGLEGLLGRIENSALPARVRLSSLEPLEWSDGLLRAVSTMPWICPHFHVPLQSGDDRILALMHRPYTSRQYGDLIRELRLIFPDAALGADVLVGFPGETEREFMNTLRLVEELPLTYLHVFPFSPRPGTPAANMPGIVPGDELKKRARLLQDVSARKRRLFGERFLGRIAEVLVESAIPTEGWMRGTTENYLQVLFPATAPVAPGTMLSLRLVRFSGQQMIGEPVEGGTTAPEVPYSSSVKSRSGTI